MTIETGRLRLRDWREEDIEPFIRHLNVEPVMRWLGGVRTPEQQVAAVRERFMAWQESRGFTFWAVERKADGELLGFCGLKRVNSAGTDLTGQFEIGWRLRESAWGQGYAKEAAIASLDLAFGKFGAPHVVALTIGPNSESQGLMKRLGMSRRDDLDFDDPRFGPDMNPTIVYRIDAGEWPAARAIALV